MTRPSHLGCEHLGTEVLGLRKSRPRLSWWLPDDHPAQTAYEVRLDDGRTARVDSDRHVLTPWPFESLRSRDRVEWSVRSWMEADPSEWSEPASIEAGLLRSDDWTATWIEPDELDVPPPGERPVWILERQVLIEEPAPGARLYATAHGIYEVYLNGRRVGDHELAPGFTSYETRLHVQTHDVSDHLVPGSNTWTVLLSDGWYRGRHGNSQGADGFGERVAFLGQLESGDVVATTGDAWEAATGQVVAADLMAGQIEDRRIEPGPWRPVVTVDHGFEELTSSPAPPVRRIEEIRPQSVSGSPGEQVFDLGQNINGWMRLDRLGPAGTEITLTHGEALDAAGDVTVDHLEPSGVKLGQVDRVVSAGTPGDTFEPRHTVHGFQYVRVEGHPDELTPADMAGIVVHTDLRRTGSFRCSDERINRFHRIAEWSFRDNACDIPTDCPQRERSGWTGDWQLFFPSASFLYDVAGFSVKWLRDLAAEQLGNGLLPNYAPDPRRRRALAEGDLNWLGLFGSAGWADACVLVPWELHQHYGDDSIIEELWPTMRRWLHYAEDIARTKRHPSRIERRPAPDPHEVFLWDAGWHFGEWCEPDTGGEPWYAVDQGHVATAYLHRTASLAARIGRQLGHHADADHLEGLAAGALDAWRTEYVADDGSVLPDTQANLVRALAFDLVPADVRADVADRLVTLIRDAGTHLGTGFLATPYLLPVLADTGHLDVAYELLLQDSPPSWLTMVDRGATTVWEEWEGIDADGVAHASLNHYSKGAVIAFFHRYIAGIQPIEDEIAYRRFRVAPRPGGGLTAAEASFDSPRGRIEVSWRITETDFEVRVTVPPGTTAELLLPDGSTTTVTPGTVERRCAAP